MWKCCPVLLAVFAAALLLVSSAQADFGFRPGAEGFSVEAIEEDGSPDAEAGSHPYELTIDVNFKTAPGSAEQPGGPFTEGDLRDVHFNLPAGMIGNPLAVPQCSLVQFNQPRESPFEESRSGESCPDETQIGTVTVHTSLSGGSTRTFGVFNLTPPPGAPSEFGFSPFGTPMIFIPRIRESANGEYGLTLDASNFPQHLDVYGFKLAIWGVPWLQSHDGERGNCLDEVEPEEHYGALASGGEGEKFTPGTCSIYIPEGTSGFPPESHPPKPLPPLAFLTLPVSCSGPMEFTLSADSWQQPTPVSASSTTSASLHNCPAFTTIATVQLSTDRASTPTALDFRVDADQGGLTKPELRASSSPKKAVISGPEGMTINPSLGAGLGDCTPAQYAAETISSAPGAGCPNSSKIGTVTVESPLFEGQVNGAVFVAEPDKAATTTPGAENPFDTLIAVYVVAKSPERGLLLRFPGKLEPDAKTGRIVATFDDLPQLPYSHLDVHFRAGQRAPLASPPTCGGYLVQTALNPWVDPQIVSRATSSFLITKGINGANCPTNPPPFAPQSQSGDVNSNAGSYTPFYLHLTRSDGDQEITSYSALLPPGLTGKLAGIPYCPDAAIEAAKRETGVGELEHPSCPAASEIGHTVTGYGLGSVLTYAPGKLYLAGPYHGLPFSIVAVDSALVGPFDLGVVIVRSAIKVNPLSTQVSIDSAGSDPIPHILGGIPLHLRDIRVYISRPEFTLNPTSCEPSSVSSTMTGSAAPFTNPFDISATAVNHFQVSNCSSLSFAPKMSIKLFRNSRRAYPALQAVVRERPGDANIGRTVVTLPSTEFLAQEHLDSVCTTHQFAEEKCPAGSIYGHVSATSPLMEKPLEGPVYLRSSPQRLLPDLVADINGQVHLVIVGHIESAGAGGMRASFEGLPDAPASKFVFSLDGGKKGLLQNGANVCSAHAFAVAHVIGQDNDSETLKVPVKGKCGGKDG